MKRALLHEIRPDTKAILVALGKHHLLTLNHLQRLVLNHEEKQTRTPSAAQNLLDVLQRSIQFDAAWVLKFDPASLNISDIHLDRFCQKTFSKYLDFFYTKAPIPTIRQIRKEGYVSKRGSDLVETEVWVKSPFYQEVIDPLELKLFMAGACIDEKQRSVGLIVLWRSRGRYDFSSRDCIFLERASLACAALLNRAAPVEADLDRPEILRLVARHSDPAVILLGGDQKIGFINQEAKNILSMVQSGKEQLSRTSEEKFFQKLSQLRSRVLKNPFHPEPDGNSTPLCEIFPFRGATFSCRGIRLEGDGRGEGLVMILIETVSEKAETVPALHQWVSEFTAREEAVTKLVSRGYTNKEIASDMGIGVHTVKDHIKNIMGKLKTNTRSGIVAKIMVRSMPGLHLH